MVRRRAHAEHHAVGDAVAHRARGLAAVRPARVEAVLDGRVQLGRRMRQLLATGWMSNRGRQIVASCLVNELGIDWRFGAAFFEQQLIDYDVGSNYGNCNLFMDSGMLYLYMSSNDSSFDVVSGGYIGTPDINNWSHVAVSRSGNTIRAFMNGKCNHTTTSSATLMDPASSFQIGYRNNSDYFKGFICDFRVVKGTAVYKQEFTPPTSPLGVIPNTVLLCCQNKLNRINYVVSPSAVQEAGAVGTSQFSPYDTDIKVSQGPAANYPTFNDGDCGNNITLSRGGLYYSLTAQQMLTRATVAIKKGEGSFYWEYRYLGTTPGSVGFTPGIVDVSAVRDTDYIGETTYGYGLFYSGTNTNAYNNNSGNAKPI